MTATTDVMSRPDAPFTHSPPTGHIVHSATAARTATPRRKPLRRLHPSRLSTDFSPSPPPAAHQAAPPDAISSVAISHSSAAPVLSLHPTPAQSSASQCHSSLAFSSRSPAVRLTAPAFRSVRRRCLQPSSLPPVSSQPDEPAFALISGDGEGDVVEVSAWRHKRAEAAEGQQCSRGPSEDEREAEWPDSLPALETEEGQQLQRSTTANAQTQRRDSNSAPRHFERSRVRARREPPHHSEGRVASRRRAGGGGVAVERCIDLTEAQMDSEATQPLKPPSPNSLTTRAGGRVSAVGKRSDRQARKRGECHDALKAGAAAEDSSGALQYIQAVCEAVDAARQDTARRWKSQRRKGRCEVIELVSEQSASDDDAVTVTHIVRQPSMAAQSSSRAPSPPRACVESVKSREVRASLPGYACPDCHAFHAVAHGDRAGHLEGLCRHRYSQSAARTHRTASHNTAVSQRKEHTATRRAHFAPRTAPLLSVSPPPASPEHFWDIATPPSPMDEMDAEGFRTW